MDNSKNHVFEFKRAATAGTTVTYHSVPNRPFIVHGYSWFYEATEGNADNTIDFAIDWTLDGTTFTGDVLGGVIKANGNANGLADTGTLLTVFDRRADAASGGAAALATDTDFGPVRVPANAVIRGSVVTAGTSAVAVVVTLYGAFV